MSDKAVEIMNKPECDCDQEYIKELGLHGHFGNCKFLLSLSAAELALIYGE